MKIVIDTQYRENYGAHDWNGEGKCPQYWKCKGGYVYVIPNLSMSKAQEILDEKIQEVIALVSYSNSYAEEQVISYDIHHDDEVLWDSWEEPTTLHYENNMWIARKITPNGEYGYMNKKIVEKHQEYQMLPDGVQENHKCVYVLTSGEVVPAEEIMNYLK